MKAISTGRSYSDSLLAAWRSRTIADLTAGELDDILVVLVLFEQVSPGEAEAFSSAVRAGAPGLMPGAQATVLDYLKMDVYLHPQDVRSMLGRRAKGTTDCVGC